jgi:two-component system chemotaxis sensor kinase CheA
MTGYVIVLEAAGRKIGLVVDDVLDTEEIVVKPLSGPLRSSTCSPARPFWATAR